MIYIKNLKKIYNHHTVIDIESLMLECGRIFLCIGPNGSGKTTLLKLIDGIEMPSSGEINIKVCKKKRIMCTQKPYMFYGTVNENLNYGLFLQNKKNNNNVDYDLIERLKLSTLLKQNAKTLSAGQMQRVALVRALLCNPELVLLDEPTANLDQESNECVEKEILYQHKKGVAFVIASHNLNLQVRLDAEIIKMDSGRIISLE